MVAISGLSHLCYEASCLMWSSLNQCQPRNAFPGHSEFYSSLIAILAWLHAASSPAVSTVFDSSFMYKYLLLSTYRASLNVNLSAWFVITSPTYSSHRHEMVIIRPLQLNSLFPISLLSKMYAGGRFIIHYSLPELILTKWHVANDY